MPNLFDTTAPQQSVRWSATKRLIQAAALASALIPLGAVAVEGALISCVTSEADSIGCNGVTGDYTGSGEQTNTWKFYETAVLDPQTQQYVFQDLLYNFEITGTPAGTFSLFVQDNHVAASESTEYTLPEGVDCIPIYDTNTCVTFNVQTVEGTAAWIGDYTILMRWFAPEGAPGSSAMKPLNDGNNHIYRAASGSLFDDQLVESLYDPNPDPIDPALSGKGDSFSSFIAGRDVANVPEPSMLLLLGSGLAAGLYRRRRQG